MRNNTKGHSRLYVALTVLLIAVIAISVAAIATSAASTIETVGEMVNIKATFADYVIQDTKRLTDDGYVGETQYTAFYDTSKGAVKTGYEGTPVIVYTINHPGIERVGTDSNEVIIQSMLDRGYVVVVLDYLNNEKAVSPAIDWSSQQFRTNLRGGKILTATGGVIPSGNIDENFLAPSGCNVLLNQVFWEIDKHAAEGTLEKIVENWNSDFRATKGTKLLKWVHEDGTRKAVQKDFDGNSPVWYNASGKADENGQYTYVKFTKAEVITDCVDPDGSFIDMNLYLNLVYPTNPEKEVPVMSLANSSGHPTTSVTGADLRPHSNGFLYNGYANAVFDYLWQPMARSASWGYYDGSAGVTQDHMNYGLMMYNDKLVNTAAMRYLRYISLADTETYNFDLDNFGVYGNSKGGWFAFLGEASVQVPTVDASQYSTLTELEKAIDIALSEFVPDRYFNGHHGETRYQVGAGVITGDGFTVKAGELQPWITYNGKEIISGCQFTNPCNGSQQEDITAGHAPIFISGNMTDTYNAAFGYSNDIRNICRNLNIPLLCFEVPIGHTLTSGIDMNYNVDTYENYFNYIDYYLKDAAITVAYMSPMNNAGRVKVTDKIEIHFAGAATREAVETITVKTGDTVVGGAWTSEFGGTVWTFTPDFLAGDTEYTVTIPATFAGDNGVKMGEAYTSTFITEFDVAVEATSVSGNYYTFTAPAFTTGNSFVLRFNAGEGAANTAAVYAVSAVGADDGILLDATTLRGDGTYELDVTDYVAANRGKEIVLLLKEGKTVADTVIKNDSLTGALSSDISKSSKATFTTGATIDGVTALKVVPSGKTTNGVSVYYSNTTHLLTYKNITGGYKTTPDNLGRYYTFSIDVYDTADRVLQIKLNSMTNRVDYGTIDYDHIILNVNTKANEWTTITFNYRVYEADYGKVAYNNVQSLALYLSPDGNTDAPVYLKNLTVTEHVTELGATNVVLSEKYDASGAYTAPTSTSPFAIYNGETLVGEYASFKDAITNYKSGYTMKLQSDYTFTDSDVIDKLASFAVFNLDLGGYTLTSANTKNSILWIKATSTASTAINVEGGSIILGRTALISYENATTAGSGKNVTLNLNSVYVSVAENSSATELISATTTTSGVLLTSKISLTDCYIDIRDCNRVYDATVILPASTYAGLTLSYEVKGGTIYLDSQRWITIADNAKIVEFTKNTEGNYVSLVMPKSNTYAISGSYLIENGYASFVKHSEEKNIVTYVPNESANSTRYGVIPDAYLDAAKYPFLIFKDGNFVSAPTDMKAVVTAASDLMKSVSENETCEILLRTNHTTTTEPTWGTSKGTIIFDLGGHTLTRGKLIFQAVVNSSTPMHETNVIFKNGRLETKSGCIGVTHCLYKTTSVKTYNITFENVTFGFASGATGTGSAFWAIWQNGHPTVIDTNITLRDCTFDLSGNTSGKTAAPFVVNGVEAKCDVVVEGGKVIGGEKSLPIFASDAQDTIVLKKNSAGEYLKFEGNGKVVTDNFLCDDGKYRYFELNEETNTYELKENTLATPYGVIPKEYEDTEKYPFVLFDQNKNFIGAYSYFNGINGAQGGVTGEAKEKINKKNVFNYDTGVWTNDSNKSFIYMRRDYVLKDKEAGDEITEYYDNLAQLMGEMTLDLGGYTLSQNPKDSKNHGLFPATSKRWSTTTNSAGQTIDKVFPSTINVVNGKLLVSENAVIKYESGSTSTKVKVYTFNFDNVTFGLAEGATTENLIVQYGKSNYDGGLVINLSDTCAFDLSAVVPTNNLTLINANNTLSKVDTKITVCGVKIIASDLSKVTVVGTVSANTELAIVKGSTGEYMILTTPTTAKDYAHYNKSILTSKGDMYFVETEDNGINSTYHLKSLNTPYGTAPTTQKYLSAVDYPFFVFFGGEFKSAETTWKAAVTKARSFINSADKKDLTAEIVMRRDYDVYALEADGVTARDKQNNFNDVHGTIIVDLGGYSMNNIDTYIIDTHIGYSASTSTHLSSIHFKNGTLHNQREKLGMIPFGHGGTSANGSKKAFSYTFENVTFRTNGTIPVINDWKHTAATGLDLFFRFVDCTFDFTGSANGCTMFAFTSTQKNVVATFTFEGGNIIADTMNNYTLVSFGAEDKIIAKKNANGNYITLTQLTLSPNPTMTLTGESGKAYGFVETTTDGNYTIFSIAEPTVSKYGEIPANYPAEKYPFAVFDEKGNFLGAFESLLDVTNPYNDGGAINKAKSYMSSNSWNGTSWGANEKSAIILLRGDYVMAENENYDNVAQVMGTCIIDLDGHTLTAPKNRVMFPAAIKPWSGKIYPTEIVVMGGNINVVNSALIGYSAWSANGLDVSGKVFSFTFMNCNITATGTADNIFVKYEQHNQTPDAIGNGRVDLINCTLDVRRAPTDAVLFNLGNGYINSAFNVIGGTILTEGDTLFTGGSDNATGTLTFAKEDGKNYTTLVLPKGTALPVSTVNGGKLTFVKIGEDDTTETYRLRATEVASLDFTPLASVTVWRDLIFNVYVPAISELKGFTLDGVTYADLSALEKINVDGSDYYAVRIPLASREALRDIVLKANVATDETNATATFTFNTIKYAKLVLDGGTDVECTLVRDMLSYVRAAYTYFGTEDDEAMAEIDEILGKDYDKNHLHKEEGNTVANTTGIKGAAFVLDATPAIRFYLMDGQNVSDFTFYVGGTPVKTITGTDTNGAYVEIDVYAYAMCETVTYTVNGEEGGSYHIASYYKFVSEGANANLINLVDRLWRYFQSARDYKNSVTA